MIAVALSSGYRALISGARNSCVSYLQLSNKSQYSLSGLSVNTQKNLSGYGNQEIGIEAVPP